MIVEGEIVSIVYGKYKGLKGVVIDGDGWKARFDPDYFDYLVQIEGMKDTVLINELDIR